MVSTDGERNAHSRQKVGISMKNRALFLIQVILFYGCVTTTDDATVTSADLSLQVSCAGRPEVFNEPYIGISCTFKNLLDVTRPLKIQSVQVRGNESEFLVLGVEEIRQLALVYNDRHLDNNNLVFLGALLISVAAKSGDTSAAAQLGVLGMVANSTLPTTPVKYSDSHLLSDDVTMEKQGVLVKNLFVSRPNNDSVPVNISICLAKPNSECISLRPEISHDIYRLRQYDQTH